MAGSRGWVTDVRSTPGPGQAGHDLLCREWIAALPWALPLYRHHPMILILVPVPALAAHPAPGYNSPPTYGPIPFAWPGTPCLWGLWACLHGDPLPAQSGALSSGCRVDGPGCPGSGAGAGGSGNWEELTGSGTGPLCCPSPAEHPGAVDWPLVPWPKCSIAVTIVAYLL